MPLMSSKTLQAKTAHSQERSSAGPKGAALAPPRYGIDFIDRQVERENNTGLPDQLKAGIEHLSGLAMDDVRVHYHSSKPAALQALAYTQGTEIHVGPRQERHLPHEAWHVVQQKEGRVQPTRMMKAGVQVNDEEGLEREADLIGKRAVGVPWKADAVRPEDAGNASNRDQPPAAHGAKGPRRVGFTAPVIQRNGITPPAVAEHAAGQEHDEEQEHYEEQERAAAYQEYMLSRRNLEYDEGQEGGVSELDNYSYPRLEHHQYDEGQEQPREKPRKVKRPKQPVIAPQVVKPSISSLQREVKPTELEFMTNEELLIWLETLSLTEIYSISQSLAEMYKSSKDKPKHVATVEKYLADQFVIVMNEIKKFTDKTSYLAGKTLSMHELFGNVTLTLYPLEGKNPLKEEKASHRPHRPILDIEFVGRKPYARCYLGLYAPAAPDSQFKDITARDTGEITLKDIGLMNLGNPFKALLWCEDYLTNQEHYRNRDKDKTAPKPVVRSFLVPLSDTEGLLLGEVGTRPLDQDRGSGQFGNLGDSNNIYAKVLHPLIGSLVSFFHDQEDYRKASDKGQKNTD